MFTPEELLGGLGYVDSRSWVSDLPTDPRISSTYRHAARAQVVGTYTFPTSPSENDVLPDRPVVQVAYAKTREEAREIHKKLWNLGQAPFLMVILPGEIRVYSAFSYDRDHDETLVKTDLNSPLETALAALSGFHAAEIDSGRIWETWGSKLKLNDRVDRRLLNDLRQLAINLVNHLSLDRNVAHALIGKYTYFHYLRAREILSDTWLTERSIEPSAIFGRAATVRGFQKLAAAVEDRFNGKVFPLPLDGPKAPTTEHIEYVASVFAGDSPAGQIALNFDIYDFSFIPVELLSAIYEQFLAVDGRGARYGAVYTPEPLAEYVINELDSVKPLQSHFRVLDPCCGSGIFLVLAYRRLIEQRLAREPHRDRLRPSELREILERSIYGVDRDLEACYVAEFSLLLTLLSYLQPADLHLYKNFRFPDLHNRQIFHSDFFDDSSSFWKKNLKFDWVVGNPPWISLRKSDEDHVIGRQWIDDNPGAEVSRYRVHEAFTWRVLDTMAPSAVSALIVQATTLTNPQSEGFRKAFFKRAVLQKVTNFANLAYILFGRDGVAALIVFTPALPGVEREPIVHYGPFVANQVPIRNQRGKRSWAVMLYGSDIRDVDPIEAASGKGSVWKMALWGTPRDTRAIRQLNKIIPLRLAELAKRRGWNLSVGVMLVATGDHSQYGGDSLSGLAVVDPKPLAKTGRRYTIPASILIENKKLFVRKRGGRKGLGLLKAPHLVFGVNYACYHDHDFIVPHPQPGLSAPETDRDHLKALSVYYSSEVARYLAFFESSTWGIERSTVALRQLECLPVPDFSAFEIFELAALYDRLAATETEMFGDSEGDVQREADRAVMELLRLPNNLRIIIQDFCRLKLQFNKGKVGGSAVSAVRDEDLMRYGRVLQRELAEFTGTPHQVAFHRLKNMLGCYINPSVETPEPILVKSSIDDSLANRFAALREQKVSWLYVQRTLRVFDRSGILLLKANRRMDWSRSEALHDSDDVISEILRSAAST